VVSWWASLLSVQEQNSRHLDAAATSSIARFLPESKRQVRSSKPAPVIPHNLPSAPASLPKDIVVSLTHLA
jgi:hypothetical protein